MNKEGNHTRERDSPSAGPPIDVERLDRDWLFSFCVESEECLRTIIGIFNANSYLGQPDDLLLMSDLPRREVWVARHAETREILAACETTVEGRNIPPLRGGRQSLNWLISHNYPALRFDERTGIRIERRGGDRLAIKLIIERVGEQISRIQLPGESLSYIGLICEIEDFKDFESLDYRPVALMDPGEDCRSHLLVIRGCATEEKNPVWPDVIASHFARQVIYWLISSQRNMPPSAVLAVLEKCRVCRQRVIDLANATSPISSHASVNKSNTLNRNDFHVFVTERGFTRLSKMNLSDCRAWKENMDALRGICLLHFGGYIRPFELPKRLATILIAVGLQNNTEYIDRINFDDCEILSNFFRQLATTA